MTISITDPPIIVSRTGRRRRHRNSNPAELSGLSRLWSLRILVQLKCHHRFTSSIGFTDDAMAIALGLERWVDESIDATARQDVLRELKALHTEAEHQCDAIMWPEALASNIAKLGELANLDQIDRQILAFTILLHNDPLLQSACRLLSPIASHALPAVLASILQLRENEVRAALGRDGKLIRTGLVSIVHYDDDIHGKLSLVSRDLASLAMLPGMEVTDLLRGVASSVTPPHLHMDDYLHLGKSLDILTQYLHKAMGMRRKGVNIFLYGPPGTGKTQLAKLLAATLESDLFEVASEDDDGDPKSGEKRLCALRAAQCFFGKGKSMILFDEVEDVFGNGASFFHMSTAQKNKGWMNRMLEGNDAPTLWLSNNIDGIDPAFIRRFDMVIEVPVPPRSQRERIARAICGDLVDQDGIACISACEFLAPAVIERACNVTRTIKPDLDPERINSATLQIIDSILASQGHPSLRTDGAVCLPDLYDPDFIHADADLLGIATGLKASRSGRLCLFGPPGTGKTAYGRWLAQQLDMPLVVKRASDLVSPYVGMTEMNMARAFRNAEREGALLLIDEVDSFLQDRRNAGQSWQIAEVNEMLTQMEAFSGVFIASTNLMDGLDQAALRRFDLKVKFDFLKPGQAAEMVRRHCNKLGLGIPERLEDLARLGLRGLTPGDFAAVMRQHRFRPITTTDELITALQAECSIKERVRPPIGFVH